MKPKRVLLLTATVVLVLSAACGMWLYAQKQQYERNRRLTDALTIRDVKTALALVNAGADPNTPMTLLPAPTLADLLDQLLHPAPPPVNTNPTAFLFACGEQWHPPLGHPAPSVTMEEDLPLLKEMLNAGADIRVTLGNRFTALHTAARLNRPHTAELLIQHGADVNAQDQAGHTPLIEAAQNRTVDVTRLLLSQGAKPDMQDVDGYTALYWAVEVKSGKVVIPELLAHGADPNVRGKYGDTPLHLAQKKKRPDLVRLLTGGAGR